jgi:NADPH2:quinone reductase
MADPAHPDTTRELRSSLDADGTITLSLRRGEVPPPGPDQVVVRVEAAPVNPSDLGALFAGADLDGVTAVQVDGEPAVAASLPRVDPGLAGRVGMAIPVGNEGAGTVVAAGSSPAARRLLGRVVGFLSGNAYAEYRTIHVSQCLAMGDGTSAEAAAAAFVNPLTALGMVDTMRLEGHSGLVHTVGASNLGLMLHRICLEDDVPLVNIVRRPEHVTLLREQGAAHVCDSSASTFRDDLHDALRATGATIAFDAIGGGELAGTLLSAMERVARESSTEFSRYGSDTLKQVYIYGGLDRGPTILHRDFGMAWAIGGWLLMPFLARVGQERADELRQRVADGIESTFASSYGMRLGLADALDPEQVRRYGRMATGDKALILPQH